MAYKVLYRKYRPDTFDKIVGQKTIVDNIKNSIKQNTFSHAYIFTGPRGTGKTSTAKVFAKALTCTNIQEAEPCGKCPNCQNFQTSPDIIEIDAASNNGVNEIRELRNNINLAPAESKYKIYIIDEVHMLTTGAFNALLKTLEEPPAHAIFILATTEVYKVPITILSRCQRYDFKKITRTDMIEHLIEICHEENISYEDNALEEIYELSEGCMRDALSILDQTSKSKEKITVDNLLRDYNMISNQSIEKLLVHMKKGEIEDIVEMINNYQNAGINAQRLIKKMINYLEKKAIEIKIGQNRDYEYSTISSLIENLNKCYIDARINENVFTIIKLCFLEEATTAQNPNQIIKSEEIASKNMAIPQPQETNKTANQEEQSVTKEQLSPTDIRINNCFVDASKNALKELNEVWNTIANQKIASIDKTDYTPVAAGTKYAIFTGEEESLVNLFNIKKEEIEKSLKESIDIKVIAITTKKWAIEKEKYIDNIKKHTKYEYIEEPKKQDSELEIKKEAENLFAENVVEVS